MSQLLDLELYIFCLVAGSVVLLQCFSSSAFTVCPGPIRSCFVGGVKIESMRERDCKRTPIFFKF